MNRPPINREERRAVAKRRPERTPEELAMDLAIMEDDYRIVHCTILADKTLSLLRREEAAKHTKVFIDISDITGAFILRMDVDIPLGGMLGSKQSYFSEALTSKTDIEKEIEDMVLKADLHIDTILTGALV